MEVGGLRKIIFSQVLSKGNSQCKIRCYTRGTEYYIRGGAGTDNPGNYYNYSTQVELQTQ